MQELAVIVFILTRAISKIALIFNIVIIPIVAIFLFSRLIIGNFLNSPIKRLELAALILSGSWVFVQLTYGIFAVYLGCDGQCGTVVQKAILQPNSFLIEDHKSSGTSIVCNSVCKELLDHDGIDFIEIRLPDYPPSFTTQSQKGTKTYKYFRLLSSKSSLYTKCTTENTEKKAINFNMPGPSSAISQYMESTYKQRIQESVCDSFTPIQQPVSDYLITTTSETNKSVLPIFLDLFFSIGRTRTYRQVVSNIHTNEIIGEYRQVSFSPQEQNLSRFVGGLLSDGYSIARLEPNSYRYTYRNLDFSLLFQ